MKLIEEVEEKARKIEGEYSYDESFASRALCIWCLGVLAVWPGTRGPVARARAQWVIGPQTKPGRGLGNGSIGLRQYIIVRMCRYIVTQHLQGVPMDFGQWRMFYFDESAIRQWVGYYNTNTF